MITVIKTDEKIISLKDVSQNSFFIFMNDPNGTNLIGKLGYRNLLSEGYVVNILEMGCHIHYKDLGCYKVKPVDVEIICKPFTK